MVSRYVSRHDFSELVEADATLPLIAGNWRKNHLGMLTFTSPPDVAALSLMLLLMLPLLPLLPVCRSPVLI